MMMELTHKEAREICDAMVRFVAEDRFELLSFSAHHIPAGPAPTITTSYFSKSGII